MRVGSCPEMVGRDAELQDLLNIIARISERRSVETAVVVGHPGMGKTRLVEALRSALTREICFICYCTAPTEHAEPLAPLVQLLRAVTVAGLASVTLEPTQIFCEALRVVHELARVHPVVIVLEDIHFADAGTVDFIRAGPPGRPPALAPASTEQDCNAAPACGPPKSGVL